MGSELEFDDLYSQACRAYADHDYTRAIELFSQCMELRPDHAMARYRRGLATMRTDSPDHSQALADFAATVPELTKNFIRHPDERIFGAVCVLDACAASESEYASRAYFLWCRALAHYARNRDIPFDKEHASAACNDLSELITLQPNNVQAHLFRGLIEGDRYNSVEAIKDLDAAATIDKTRVDALVLSGQHKLYEDPKHAIDSFTNALNIDASHAGAWLYRAKAFLECGRYHQAIDDATKALEFKANATESHFVRGAARWKRNDLEGAVADFNAAADATISKDYNVINEFSIWVRDEAIEAFTELIKQQPHSYAAYLGRGFASHFYGQPRRMVDKIDSAIKDFTKAIQLDPKCPAAFYFRALSDASIFRTIDEDLDRALALDPTNVDALALRGWERKGPAGLADCCEAVRLQPKRARFLQSALFVAYIVKDQDAIRSLAEKLVERDGGNSTHLSTLASAQFDKGDIDSALETYTQRLMQHPEDDCALRGRAEVFIELGRREAAIAEYKEYIRFRPDDKDAEKRLREIEQLNSLTP